MEKTQGQEKYFKVLELLSGCREKLFATYELFVANLEQTKQIKTALGEIYERLLDLHSEYVQLTSSGKPAKMRIAKLCNDAKELNSTHYENVDTANNIMSGANACCYAYKKEISMCCKAFKQLMEKIGNAEVVKKGYRQQVKLVKRILEKIDIVKVDYKTVKEEIKEQTKMFLELFEKINQKELVLN